MDKGTRAIIITSVVAITAITVAVLIVKSARKRVTKKSFKKKIWGNSIITTPDTPFKKFDVIVVFGGLHYATPEWMYQEMKKSTPDLLYSNIVIFLPYTSSIGHTNEAIKAATAGKSASAFSMIGFSKGGENVVLRKDSKKWRFVGLIDPSTGHNFAKRSWGKESHMTYGSKPMMDIYASRYKELDTLINKGRGVADKSVTVHKQAPSAFFVRFKKQINHGA